MTKRASRSDLNDLVTALRKAAMALTLADYSNPEHIVLEKTLWADAMQAIDTVEHLLFDDEKTGEER